MQVTDSHRPRWTPEIPGSAKHYLYYALPMHVEVKSVFVNQALKERGS